MSPSSPASTVVRSITAHARRHRVRLLLGVATVGAAAAAGVVLLLGTGNPGDAPVPLMTQPGFRPGAAVPCLEHQTERPNRPYQGGAGSQSRPELTFLAYYTAAGRKPFCDGGAATDVDRAWAQLYVQLTTNAENVSTILG